MNLDLSNRAATANYRARINGLYGNITSDDLQYALNYFDNNCAYCGNKLSSDFEFDHMIPIGQDEESDDMNFGSTLSNIVPTCRECNSKKGVKSFREYVTNTDLLVKLESWVISNSDSIYY